MARIPLAALFAALLFFLAAYAPAVKGDAYPGLAANAASALLSDLDARFDEVLAAINNLQLTCGGPAASASPSPVRASPSASPSTIRPSVSPSASPSTIRPSASPALLKTVTVGPGQTYTEPADAIPYLAPGFTMTVLAGTYLKPFDIPNTLGGWTINGAGAGKTIFDGQGGAGSGHRLAWGKGFIHTQCPGKVTNIVFRNCGGADRAADGEAGVYAEYFTSAGTVTVDKCLFDSNENGIFVPNGVASGNPGYGVSMVVTNSDFINNGQSGDGGSHDLYVQGASYSETNCNHYGNPYGNNIKVRAPLLSVTGGYHANVAGSRWIDFPNGGTATVSGGVWTIPSSSPGANILSYAVENQNNGVTGGMSFSGGAKLYIGRYNSQIYVYTGGLVSFDSTVVLNWTSTGATINKLGSGTVSGIAFSPNGATIVAEPAVPAHASGN